MFGLKKKENVKTYIEGRPQEASAAQTRQEAAKEEYMKLVEKSQPAESVMQSVEPETQPVKAETISNYIEANVKIAKLPIILLLRIESQGKIMPVLLRIDEHDHVNVGWV